MYPKEEIKRMLAHIAIFLLLVHFAFFLLTLLFVDSL